MGSLEGQHRWYEEYSKRPGDWYFAIERKSSRKIEGTVAIYGFDPDANNAEWGRWILIPRSLAAIESALLIYRAAFDELDLSEVYCRTLVENEQDRKSVV